MIGVFDGSTLYVACMCAACGTYIEVNPVRCPSLRVEGERRPICRTCFEEWNRIHRDANGLPRVELHADAYRMVPEGEA